MHQTTEAQTEALKQKESYIERLAKELEAASYKHSAESNKLRLEIDNLEGKHKELQDDFYALKKSRDQLEAANHDLQLANECLIKKTQDGNHAASQEFESWKDQTSKEFTEKEQVLREELRSQTVNHAKELEDSESKWAQEKKVVEMNYCQQNQKLQNDLEASQRKLEEAMASMVGQRDTWNTEREALNREWQQDRLLLVRNFDNQKKEMIEIWEASQAKHIKHLEDENARLRKGWDQDKMKFTEATGELKLVAANLQRTLENFGDTVGLRSKGDVY